MRAERSYAGRAAERGRLDLVCVTRLSTVIIAPAALGEWALSTSLLLNWSARRISPRAFV
jgi:hypothetical protein